MCFKQNRFGICQAGKLIPLMVAGNVIFLRCRNGGARSFVPFVLCVDDAADKVSSWMRGLIQ